LFNFANKLWNKTQPIRNHYRKYNVLYGAGIAAFDIYASENKNSAVLANVLSLGGMIGAKALAPKHLWAQMAGSLAGYAVGRTIGHSLFGEYREEEGIRLSRAAKGLEKTITEDKAKRISSLYGVPNSIDISPSYNRAQDVFAFEMGRASGLGASENQMYKRMSSPYKSGNYMDALSKAGTALHMIEEQKIPSSWEAERFVYDPMNQISGHVDLITDTGAPIDVKTVSVEKLNELRRSHKPRKKDVSQVNFYMSMTDSEEGGIKYVAREDPSQSLYIPLNRDRDLLRKDIAKLQRVRAKVKSEMAAGFLNPELVPKTASLETLQEYDKAKHPDYSQAQLQAIFDLEMRRAKAAKGLEHFGDRRGKYKYNTIEGLKHGGFAGASRRYNTDFGSGFQGLMHMVKRLGNAIRGPFRKEVVTEIGVNPNLSSIRKLIPDLDPGVRTLKEMLTPHMGEKAVYALFQKRGTDFAEGLYSSIKENFLKKGIQAEIKAGKPRMTMALYPTSHKLVPKFSVDPKTTEAMMGALKGGKEWTDDALMGFQSFVHESTEAYSTLVNLFSGQKKKVQAFLKGSAAEKKALFKKHLESRNFISKEERVDFFRSRSGRIIGSHAGMMPVETELSAAHLLGQKAYRRNIEWRLKELKGVRKLPEKTYGNYRYLAELPDMLKLHAKRYESLRQKMASRSAQSVVHKLNQSRTGHTKSFND